MGFDIHGVIDAHPFLFRKLSRMILSADSSNEVHILTGRAKDECIGKLVTDYKIDFTHFFSIVDYHKEHGTPMEKRENGWWMDDVTWNRTKGDYAERHGLNAHFDNEIEYFPYFPKGCKRIHVPDSTEYGCISRMIAKFEMVKKEYYDTVVAFIGKDFSEEDREIIKTL